MDQSTINIEQATTEATTWLDAVIGYLPRVVFAILVIITSVLIGRLLRTHLRRVVAKRVKNQTIAELIASISGVIIIAIGVVSALRILHLDDAVTSILAGAGIIGLALGFAFQDVAANFLSGIIIATQKPFSVGDLIETQDVFGTVKKIELRMTAVQTLTGQIVYVPNRDVLLNLLTDYTALGRRRIDLQIGVSYSDDLDKAEQVALDAISSIEGVLENPAPSLYYTEFGDSSINFDIRFWVSYSGQADYLGARSQAIKNIKSAFADNDITIPFPITTVEMKR